MTFTPGFLPLLSSDSLVSVTPRHKLGRTSRGQGSAALAVTHRQRVRHLHTVVEHNQRFDADNAVELGCDACEALAGSQRLGYRCSSC